MTRASPERISSASERARELIREARTADETRRRELLREAEQLQYGIDSHAQRIDAECDQA